MVDRDDARVEYTVKELLKSISDEQAKISEQQTNAFTRLEISVSLKADKADVERIEARLDTQDRRLGTVERRQHDDAHERQWWNHGLAKLGGIAVGVSLVASAVISAAHALGA